MDLLTLYGLISVVLMLVFYAVEDRSAWFILAFAGACLMASTYGFIQGAWPFGMVEAIWSLIAVRRWRSRRFSNLGRESNKCQPPLIAVRGSETRSQTENT